MDIKNFFSRISYGIDWLLVFFIVPIVLAGLVTMKSFAPAEDAGNFFNKQIIWVLLSFAVFFIFSFIAVFRNIIGAFHIGTYFSRREKLV